MPTDDFDMFDGLDLGIFGDEVFEDPEMERYRDSGLVQKLNGIAETNFDFAMDALDFLRGIDTETGVKAVQRIESYISNQEDRKHGLSRGRRIIDLTSSKSELTDRGFDIILEEMDNFDRLYEATADQEGWYSQIEEQVEDARQRGFLNFADYVSVTTSQIGAHSSGENLKDALHTLALTAIRDSRKKKPKTDPKAVLTLALSSDFMREYSKMPISSKIPFPKLPSQIQGVLSSAGTEDLGRYVRFLNDYPVARNFSSERFVELSNEYQRLEQQLEVEIAGIKKRNDEWVKEDPRRVSWRSASEENDIQRAREKIYGDSMFSFLSNWIGREGSEEMFGFMMFVHDHLGYDKAQRIGRPILTNLRKRSKKDPRVLEELAEEVFPKLGEALEVQSGRPKWLSELKAGLQANPEGSVSDIVEGVYDSTISKKLREEQVKGLKRKYDTLSRKIRKIGLVSVTDYFLGLDERLLNAMQEHDGKKTKMLKAMGTNLDAVNEAYRDSGLPAALVVSLYDSGKNNHEIGEVSGRISDSAKRTLKNAEEQGSLRLIFSLGCDIDNLEERVEQFRDFAPREHRIFKLAYDTQVKDSLGYVMELTEEQKEAIQAYTNDEAATDMIKSVSPDLFNTYREVRTGMAVNNFEEFTKGKIATTLRSYQALSAEEREEVTERCRAGFSTGRGMTYGEAGLMLRVYGKLEDQSHNKLLNDWHRVNNVSFPGGFAIEPILKKFTEMYGSLEEQQQEKLITSLYQTDQRLRTRGGTRRTNRETDEKFVDLVELAVKNVPKDANYFITALGFMEKGLAEDQAFAFAKDERVQDSYQQIDVAYQQTWLNFFTDVQQSDQFMDLPPTDFYLAAQAYEFARQHNQQDTFMKALDESLQGGTVGPWAKAIIQHFRDESKGGGIYREVGGKNEPARYLQVG